MFQDTIGTHATCPDYRGVLNSEVPSYRLVTFGTRKRVLIWYQNGVLILEVSTVGGSTVHIDLCVCFFCFSLGILVCITHSACINMYSFQCFSTTALPQQHNAPTQSARIEFV